MTIVFTQNPLRNSISYNDNELLKLCKTSAECFSDLPSYHLGESKDIRRTKEPGILIQKFLPTLNSITEKRKGIVLKSDSLRLDISTVFWEALHTENIPTCYLARHEAYVLMTEENLPPVEVIVKACLIGTPAKLYDGLFHLTDRFGKKFIAGETHPPYVRFDYRNPLINAKGIYLRDECMPISFADRFINTQKADSNALTIFQIIQDRLNRINLQVLDCCLLCCFHFGGY